MSEIAQRLNQEILGDKAAFSCGCVFTKRCSYPGKEWVLTEKPFHECPEHRGAPSQHIHDEVIVGHPGPLEGKWLKLDGTQVLLHEMEEAMDYWLWRAGGMDLVLDPQGRAYGKPRVYDPWIQSNEGFWAIGRHGSVAVIRARSPDKKPGALLTREELFNGGNMTAQNFNFGAGFPDEILRRRSLIDMNAIIAEIHDEMLRSLVVPAAMLRSSSKQETGMTYTTIKARDLKTDLYGTPPAAISMNFGEDEIEQTTSLIPSGRTTS